MNPHEKYVAKSLQTEGWTVRPAQEGLPDFLCYRTKPDGSMEVQFVEAKADDDKVRPEQALVISLLRAAGVTVRIIRNTGFYEWFHADEGRQPQYTALPGIPLKEAAVQYRKNPPKQTEEDI